MIILYHNLLSFMFVLHHKKNRNSNCAEKIVDSGIDSG